MDAAFYCMSSQAYFLGAVGLVNSLRLAGHREPVFLLDCGLAGAQRELLAPEVTLVPAPSTEVEPFMFKTVAPLAHPAEVMALIDADMIVTRSLEPLLAHGRDSRVAAFEDNLDRFVPEWGELLGLGAARPRRYVSSGLVALGGSVGGEVLRLWHECQQRAGVDLALDMRGRRKPDHPFLFRDQDVLNAVLCTSVGAEDVVAVEGRLAPHQPYRGVELIDEAGLRCAYADGAEPFVLHQYLGKPWLEPMYHGIYSRLLARLLLGDDVPIRVPEGELPLRMRSGRRALLERKRVNAIDLARWYARDVVPEWIGARLRSLRSGRTGA